MEYMEIEEIEQTQKQIQNIIMKVISMKSISDSGKYDLLNHLMKSQQVIEKVKLPF